MAFGPLQCRVRREEVQMESLTEVVQAIADFGWELVAFVAMALGLLFTVLFKFTQIRRAPEMVRLIDRKSTRLNSSHVKISYAVFCLKKKKDHELIHSDCGGIAAWSSGAAS